MSILADQSVSAETKPLQIALLGNPNTGKSTLFNQLTGIHQRVGNYPGVTVEKKLGRADINGKSVTVIDLPGTYSLAAESADERVVIDVLHGHVNDIKPDMVVCVLDATNLKRNLFLASQVSDIGLPMVIVLNMADEAKKQGIWIDAADLSLHLGVPVVSMVASKGTGMADLKAAIENVARNKQKMVKLSWPNTVNEAMKILGEAFRDQKEQPTDTELRRMLFDSNSVLFDDCEVSKAILDKARAHMIGENLHPSSAEAVLRYQHIDKLMEGVIEHVGEVQISTTHKVDRFLTHRLFGLVFFCLIMYGVFYSIYTGAGPAMDLIEVATGWVGDLVGGMLESMPMLKNLMVDGVVTGIGSVIIFLPQILILFFFISLLEDTGYMARVAFLMDKLFSWCGLNGRCFIPMLSSYACAIPGIIGTRTIADPKARLVTILVAPLMSCSARLPVYVIMVAAFFDPKYAALILFGMHIVGLVIALPITFILNRLILKTKAQPFVMEMPPYRVPRLRDVLWRMWHRGRTFLKDAGTIIFAMTIIIWALLYFPHGAHVEEQATKVFVSEVANETKQSEADVIKMIEAGENELDVKLDQSIRAAYIEQSFMGRAGKFVQPVFAPAGYDWKISVAVLAAFPAREVIISTLGIIYKIGGEVDEDSDTLKAAMKNSKWTEGPKEGQNVFSPLVAFSIMIFFALCSQCGSTLAVTAKEASPKWAVFTFVYMTGLAWTAAVAVYQIGSLFIT